MHLTFDTATVESICPRRSKAQTLMNTGQVLNAQPYNGMKGRHTHPGQNKGAASETALLNTETTLGAAGIGKSEGITGKIRIELSSAQKHLPDTATLLPAELTWRDCLEIND